MTGNAPQPDLEAAHDDPEPPNITTTTAANPSIKWSTVPLADLPSRGRNTTGLTGLNSKVPRRSSRSRSRSVHSTSRSFRAAPPISPQSELQIGYRTLSIHVDDRTRDKTSSDESKGAEATKKEEKEGEFFSKLEYHTLSVDALCQQLNVDLHSGLSHTAASQRLSRDGPNSLPKPKTNYYRKILSYLFGGFCSILWLAVILFFLCWQPLSSPPSTQNLSLAVLILIVIFLQAGFSAFQDWSTAKTMNSILDLLPSNAVVLREGERKEIVSKELVKGDVVELRVGDKVPADLRIVEHSGDVRFDRAVLTGESDEIEGTVDPTDRNFMETRNIAFMGTTVLNGSCTGVIVLTGPHAVMGHIAHATSNVKQEDTLIQKEVWRFVRIIIVLTIILALAIVIAWAAWLRTDHPGFLTVSSMLVNTMSSVVAFIPEGIPIAVALTLMLIARRMKAVSILPKSLSTVETLGCVNVICSDKTGTLTQGKMYVNTVALLDHEFSSPDDFHHRHAGGEMGESTRAVVRAGVLCNDAFFDPVTLGLPLAERQIQGNSTDSAVLRFASAASEADALKKLNAPVFQIPFNSKNKWQLSMFDMVKDSVENEKGHEYLTLVKGAPDVLFPSCTRYQSSSGAVLPLPEDKKQILIQLQERLSRRAERVIVLCQKSMRLHSTPKTNAFSEEVTSQALADLTVIGILGIIDPPRPEIADMILQVRRAGARFFMVTGDFRLTAAAIAKSIGIITTDSEPDTFSSLSTRLTDPSGILPFSPSSSHPKSSLNPFHKTQRRPSVATYSDDDPVRSLVLEGKDLQGLTDWEWDLICSYQEIVFARTTPEQKLRIVTELRARHNVVAVTGDGVNDAPALRAADVGVAVAGGSDVAIEAADLVLMDSFTSLVSAIRSGRLVFQNLQKVIAYLLPAGSWSEIMPVILNVFFGVPLPLSPFLMIIICVFTDLFMSLSLIQEKEEYDLMKEKPRDARRDHLVNMKLYSQAYLFTGNLETIIAHAMFFLYYWRYARIPASKLFFLFENYSAGFHGYTADELLRFNEIGQCVYFVTLVFLQWGNILAVRNRKMSIVQADPIFRKERRNLWLLLSMGISLAIAVFVTEVKGIQDLFDTRSVPIEFWFIPIPLGLGVLCIDEVRKLIVRNFPNSFVAKVAW